MELVAQKTKIFIGGKELVGAELTGPMLIEQQDDGCLFPSRLSFTFEYKLEPGRKLRKHKLALLRLSMPPDAWRLGSFYHRIKRHQERNRLKRRAI